MKKLAITLALAALLQFTGCGLNSVSTVEQPSQVLPLATFNVYVLDVFMAIDSTHVIGQEWKAESILIAPGLPAGWTVNSVKYSIDTAFYSHYAKPGDTAVGPDTLMGPTVDSLELAGKMVTATRNSSFDAGLSANWDTLNTGRIFSGYLGLGGFRIPAGTRVDTCMADTSGSMGIDSTGMKYVGCFIKINVTAPATEGYHNLAYFVGFDPGNLVPTTSTSQRQFNAISDSNIIYVGSTLPAIEKQALSVQQKLSLSISPNPARGAAQLSYYLPEALAGQAVEMAVFDISGKRVFAQGGTGVAGWNRTVSLSAGSLPSGTYVAKIRAGRQVATRSLVIMK